MVTTHCEPRLSKYDLYPERGAQKPAESVFRLMNILNYCDGEHDLLWIADRLNSPIWELYGDVDILLENKLINRILG
jgi:aminopeptidase-like protein